MDDTLGPRPRPQARYGRAPMSARSRRLIMRALAALMLLFTVGIAVVAYQRFQGTAVEGTATGYELLDDRTVSVTISVTRKDPANPVVCIVRARSRDGAETGRREILVPPSEARTVQITTKVASYRPAFVGDIYGCGTEVPGYLTTP